MPSGMSSILLIHSYLLLYFNISSFISLWYSFGTKLFIPIKSFFRLCFNSLHSSIVLEYALDDDFKLELSSFNITILYLSSIIVFETNKTKISIDTDKSNIFLSTKFEVIIIVNKY